MPIRLRERWGRTAHCAVFVTVALALFMGVSVTRIDAASSSPAISSVADRDFGISPSGEVPILFNDHTVYAKPDVLTRKRVLAALVKNGQVFVPLRSMFEQMGATVSASTDGKTVSAVKSSARVSVTLGKAEVLINGESRPLDVPPMLYKGIMLVPVRVLSEALGAYVQWVPTQRVVVIRYIPPAPPTVAPTPMPTAAPTAWPTAIPTAAPTVAPPVPTPTPTAVPTQRPYGFIQAAISRGNNYNEFSAGEWCDSFQISGAYAFRGSPFAVKADFRQDTYVTSSNVTDAIGNQYTRFTTPDGLTAFTPVFLGKQTSFDGRLEYQVAAPRIYVGVGYLSTTNNYGYPTLNALGVGVEKLPDLRSGINFFGSAFYYPSASGSATNNNPASANFGTSYRQQYAIVKYDVGLALASEHFPVYLYGGFSGDRYTAKQNAIIGQNHSGPYLGLGVKL